MNEDLLSIQPIAREVLSEILNSSPLYSWFEDPNPPAPIYIYSNIAYCVGNYLPLRDKSRRSFSKWVFDWLFSMRKIDIKKERLAFSDDTRVLINDVLLVGATDRYYHVNSRIQTTDEYAVTSYKVLPSRYTVWRERAYNLMGWELPDEREDDECDD